MEAFIGEYMDEYVNAWVDRWADEWMYISVTLSTSGQDALARWNHIRAVLLVH
jgi:hypothetical protein